MNSPIIIFNPSGLTEDQVKQVKEALDAAYKAGYETAKEFYQLKMTIPTNPGIGQTLTVPPQQQYVVTPCSHGVEQGAYPNAITNVANGYVVKDDITGIDQRYCDHSYVNNKNKALGICGKCGISFDEWHG